MADPEPRLGPLQPPYTAGVQHEEWAARFPAR